MTRKRLANALQDEVIMPLLPRMREAYERLLGAGREPTDIKALVLLMEVARDLAVKDKTDMATVRRAVEAAERKLGGPVVEEGDEEEDSIFGLTRKRNGSSGRGTGQVQPADE